MINLKQLRKDVQKAVKREGSILSNPRAVKSVKLIDGKEIIWDEIPEESQATSPMQDVAGGSRRLPDIINPNTYFHFRHMDAEAEGYEEHERREENKYEYEGEDEPQPDMETQDVSEDVKVVGDHSYSLREMALSAMYGHEAPLDEHPQCVSTDCMSPGVYDYTDIFPYIEYASGMGKP
ncbi:hypothetical protein M422DRAFT_269241 [Sphaerobolus stellatus SS14]|uniref:Unplaced genomic scaffold SPHSTscaffold_209, whole genome shotgun sequence n=1 Tax=Sphaerobolus stellatus (strain SS14) TaxID=990650 RepID=A0A0C9UVS8_SPHS4|nr:hypothetical protein M422DRAFT_269241 [Sphaerobolus stellatus SS14]